MAVLYSIDKILPLNLNLRDRFKRQQQSHDDDENQVIKATVDKKSSDLINPQRLSTASGPGLAHTIRPEFVPTQLGNETCDSNASDDFSQADSVTAIKSLTPDKSKG